MGNVFTVMDFQWKSIVQADQKVLKAHIFVESLYNVGG